MKNDQRIAYTTRDHILGFLSDAEIASVSTAETAAKLSDGEEYVDLEQLTRGVQRAHGDATNIGGVLPRKAVHEKTWTKILKQLQVSSTTAN